MWRSLQPLGNLEGINTRSADSPLYITMYRYRYCLESLSFTGWHILWRCSKSACRNSVMSCRKKIAAIEGVHSSTSTFSHKPSAWTKICLGSRLWSPISWTIFSWIPRCFAHVRALAKHYACTRNVGNFYHQPCQGISNLFLFLCFMQLESSFSEIKMVSS